MSLKVRYVLTCSAMLLLSLWWYLTVGQPPLMPELAGPQGSFPAVARSQLSVVEALPIVPAGAPATPTALALTATPGATATATRPPAELLVAARAAAAQGDGHGAIALYQAALAAGPPDDARVAAQLELGRLQLAAGRAADAVRTLRELRQQAAGERSPVALFLLAQAQLASGLYPQAVTSFSTYIDAGNTLGLAYAHQGLGDAFAALGDVEQASLHYAEANEAGLPESLQARQPEQLAAALANGGALDEAISAYDELLAVATTENDRARLQGALAEHLLRAGRSDDAYARLYDVVANAAGAPGAPAAVERLLTANRHVPAELQAFVAYRARDFDRAIALFEQVLAASGDNAARYYIAMSYAKQGRAAEALAAFDAMLAAPDGGELRESAELERLRQLADLGRTREALAGMDALAARDPEMSWSAAELAIAGGDYAGALARYEAVAKAQRYATPKVDALLRAGAAAYLAGDHAAAATLWQDILRTYPYTYRRPNILLLLGKNALAAGDEQTAASLLNQVRADYPNSYYSFRARELLEQGVGLPAFPPVDFDLAVTPAQDAAERAEADAWLAGWLGMPAGGIGELSPGLLANPQLRAGRTLWQMGLYAAARVEFEALRKEVSDDPLALYQLAIYFRDIGLYRSSIIAARRVVELSPANGTLGAPRFIGRLVYPTYYAGDVQAEAEHYDLDPLLVFGVMRQESMFESFITSYASAAGLLQVMPGTGGYIAGQLGQSRYDPADLYRPDVSVRFGVFYLAEQRGRFDGHVYAMLAAYNAGPGRSARWYNQSGQSDPDLFLALVDIDQPRGYIEAIYLNHALYRAIYGVR